MPQAHGSTASSVEAVADIIDLAATPTNTATLLLTGQPAQRHTASAGADQWLEENPDLEEVLELIADQVRLNWWDAA